MKTRLSAALAAALFLLAGSAPASADASCPPGNGHVWFLGVVYDSEQRADFKIDVGSFEFFLDHLRDIYCIPDSQAKILAFEDGYTVGSTTYDEASEDAVKDTLAAFAADANDHTDSILFFFLSSHGLQTPEVCGGLPRLGSYSALKAGGGQDGFLDDCELGDALNSNFDDDVRMVVAVDCSFCGGFSDSLTAASGTVPDDSNPSSGVPGPNRIVMTGCSMTTECFGGGSHGGAIFYDALYDAMATGATGNNNGNCDGWTGPGFPLVQGINVPRLTLVPDGQCTVSEWFYRAVLLTTASTNPASPQEQVRMKYGFATLGEDLVAVL